MLTKTLPEHLRVRRRSHTIDQELRAAAIGRNAHHPGPHLVSPLKIKATVEEVLARIPGPITKEWPMGERFAVALTHGSMSVEYYAPIGLDPQTPHEQDEVYFIHRGTGELAINGDRHLFKAGDCLFVPANVEHRFENFSSGFGTWVVFWGPTGGEAEGEKDEKPDDKSF